MSTSFAKASPNIGYGMTETNAYGPQNGGADYLRQPTSTGRATPILSIEIRDARATPVPVGERGEIWFKGPNLIRGYWNRPEATAETIVDGWLRTGDLGRLDDEGFVYVEDRAKDMVIRAGENVYCAEVEAAIYEHPAVHEAAVFGVPHERLGEEVAAVVVPRPGVPADRRGGAGARRRSGSRGSRCRAGSRSGPSPSPATRRARCSSATSGSRSPGPESRRASVRAPGSGAGASRRCRTARRRRSTRLPPGRAPRGCGRRSSRP